VDLAEPTLEQEQHLLQEHQQHPHRHNSQSPGLLKETTHLPERVNCKLQQLLQ